MPWLIGCCCVNVWMARNLLRYQYRIQGNDLIEEFAFPCGMEILGNALGHAIPCVWCIVYGVNVTLGMQLKEEVETRSNGEDVGGPVQFRSGGYSSLNNRKSYLSSSSAISTAPNMQVMSRDGDGIQLMPTVVQGAHSRSLGDNYSPMSAPAIVYGTPVNLGRNAKGNTPSH